MTASREHHGRSEDVSRPEPSHFSAPRAASLWSADRAPAPPRTPGRGRARRPGAGKRAAPGYGKTTLVADWLARADVRHLWLNLGEDAQPRGFWELGIEAFGSIDPELPTYDFLAAVASAGEMPVGTACAFVETIVRRQPTVSVVFETTTPTMAPRSVASHCGSSSTTCRHPSRWSSSAAVTPSCHCRAGGCKAGCSKSARRTWPSPARKRQPSSRHILERPPSARAR